MQTENTNNTPADCAARVALRKKADEAADRFAALPARNLAAAVRFWKPEEVRGHFTRWTGYIRTGDEPATTAFVMLDTAPTNYNTAPTPSATIFTRTADADGHRAASLARIDNRAEELCNMILADLIPA